jgi:hypothetical protein
MAHQDCKVALSGGGVKEKKPNAGIISQLSTLIMSAKTL